WSDVPEVLIVNALQPAAIEEVILHSGPARSDGHRKNRPSVVSPRSLESQLRVGKPADWLADRDRGTVKKNQPCIVIRRGWPRNPRRLTKPPTNVPRNLLRRMAANDEIPFRLATVLDCDLDRREVFRCFDRPNGQRRAGCDFSIDEDGEPGRRAVDNHATELP